MTKNKKINNTKNPRTARRDNNPHSPEANTKMKNPGNTQNIEGQIKKLHRIDQHALHKLQTHKWLSTKNKQTIVHP